MAEYTKSEIYPFDITPVHGALEYGKFVEVNPTHAVKNASSIQFEYPADDRARDLNESRLYLEFQIKKSDGGDLAAADAVAFINGFGETVFKEVNVFLNNTNITRNNNYHPYNMHLLTKLGFGKNVKKEQLSSLLGYSEDTSGQYDTLANANAGFTTRQAMTALSAKVGLVVPIPSDFCRTCTKLIPPRVDIRLEFKLHDKAFALMSAAAKLRDYDFSLVNAKLLLRVVKISESERGNVERMHLKVPYLLNYTRLDCQSFAIPAGSIVANPRGLWPDCMPKQVFVMLVETKRASGSINLNPFKFTNGGVTKMGLRQGEHHLMCEPIETDFSDAAKSSGCKLLYNYFHEGLNNPPFGSVGITYDQFRTDFPIWTWTLSPDMDAKNGIAIPYLPGNLDLDINMATGTTNEGLTILAIGIFDSTVTIDRQGSVYTK